MSDNLNETSLDARTVLKHVWWNVIGIQNAEAKFPEIIAVS